MKNRAVQLTCLLAILLGASQAQAYVPPSEYIVKNWVKKHSGAKQLKVLSTITAYSSDKPTPIHFKSITLYREDTKIIRSWATDDHDQLLYGLEHEASSASSPAKLLLTADLNEVLKTLQEVGVPLKTETELLNLRTEKQRRDAEEVSLVRWNNSIVWVLGNANSRQEPESPQLWFEKDLFLPVRYFFRAASGSELYELRFDNYKFTREFPYPRGITLSKKTGGIVLAEDMGEIALNRDVSNQTKFFSTGFTDVGNSTSHELKTLIQTYYDLMR
jgi:hypothetical protein